MISSRLVHENNTHYYLDRHITQTW